MKKGRLSHTRYSYLCSRIEVYQSRLSFFGLSHTDLDNRINFITDYAIAIRVGLAIVDSISNPADAYYIQKVVLPRSVKRLIGRSHFVVPIDFLSLSNWLFMRCPDFYNDCISWPASIRY